MIHNRDSFRLPSQSQQPAKELIVTFYWGRPSLQVCLALMLMISAILPINPAFAARSAADDLRLDSGADATETEVPAAPEQPFGGADGVEFQTVPLDASVNCSSVILKGTHRFQGTAFVLPRFVVSMNKQQEPLFEILRTEGDKFVIRFAIFFPRTDEDFELRTAGSNIEMHGCNFDEVRAELNRSIAEPHKKIHTISRVPPSTIDVKIDGVAQTFTLGGGPSSMINYQGGDQIVEFTVNSRPELDAILQRIQGDLGLGIHLHIKFNARANDGALYATVDLKQLAQNLGVALNGREVITPLELAAVIGTQLKRMSINIQTEAGSTNAYAVMVEDIMKMVMGAVFTDGSINPPIEDPYSQIGADPAQADGRPTPPAIPVLGPTELIKVATVLDALNRRTSMSITYENKGRSEQHVYSTSVLFKGQFQDPDVRIFNIVSGEAKGRPLPNRINKDVPFTISAVASIDEKIEWLPKTRLYSIKQLRTLKLFDFFPLLRDESLAIEERILHDGLAATMKETPQWMPFKKKFYVWGATEYYPKYRSIETREFEPTAQALEGLNIFVQFSKVGARKFRLADLLQENRLWKGAFDDVGAKIVILPKGSLGQMTLWNVENQAKENRIRRFVFQEHRSPSQSLGIEKASIEKMDAPTSRSTIKLQVTAGSDAGELIGLISPDGNIDDGKPILIPSL